MPLFLIYQNVSLPLQVDAPVTNLEQSNDMAVVNIWDGRRQREHRPDRGGRGTKIKTEYRCHPSLDSGWTRGERAGCSYHCIYFARGICHHGSDCNYLHRVPTVDDESRHRREPQYDIFGRDRLDEEGRTKGAGSISRDSTTLYIYLGGAATQPQELLQKTLHENFSEWGLIDEVNVIQSKGIAFVRYVFRSSTEFAKAAMHQQTLKGVAVDHVLDVRWANDDPNPRARARVKLQQEEAMAKAYLNTLSNMEPEAKRARLHELRLGTAYRPGSVAAAYPDTSDQYDDQQYEGWDARAHAEVSEDPIKAKVAQDKAIKEYQDAIWGKKGHHGQVWHHQEGGVLGVGGVNDGDGIIEEIEDDINRYLPLSDDEAALEYAEEFTEPAEMAQHGQHAEHHDSGPVLPSKQPGMVLHGAQDNLGDGAGSGGGVDSKEESENALGLLGDYGSDSE